jgi:transcription initiation factor IIE alpha subunit
MVIIQCIIVEIRNGDYTVYYCGNVVKKKVYNDRIIALKVRVKPVSILLVQVYMPTSQHADEEVQELCDIIKKLLKRMENMRQTPSLFYFSNDTRLCFRKSPCDVW